VYRERPGEVSQATFKSAQTLSVRLSIHLPHHQRSALHSSRNTPPNKPRKTTYRFHGDSLHNPPPLLFLLLLGSQPHHLAVIAHGGSSSGLVVHVALERLVEPAADEPGRVAGHLGVAGAALAVVLAAALLVGEVTEEALGGGG